MEKILVKKILEEKETLLDHAILHCCNDEVLAKIQGKPGKIPEEDGRWIEVEFKMNGVDVSISSFLNHLEGQLDEMIKEKAMEIVLEQLSDVTQTLGDIETVVKRIIKKRLNIRIPDEEW